MPENGENTFSSTEPQEPKQEKEPKTFRISLFFDGTLNNRVNIKEREKDSDVYRDFRVPGEPTSYDNGRTNIAIMEPHMEKKADGYDFYFKEYIEGQGTLDLEGDSFKGYALGGGTTGVADRADKGIDKAVNKVLSATDFSMDDDYIKKLTIDVFGFSRGAATARYAIHVLFEGRSPHVNQYTGELLYEFEPLHRRLQKWGYTIKPEAVEVCFAGLYDTVLSYYGSQYFSFTNNVLQQKAVARAKKSLHLAAADEHRKDFPLHNIKSAKAKGGEEYFLPGVHSDVGGSYNQASELALEAETNESKKVYMLTSDEHLVINRGSRKSLEQDRDYLIKQGWYLEDEIEIVEEPKLQNNYGPYQQYETHYYRLKVTRNNIRSAYCNIPLKIMAEYARKPDVNLKIDDKLEDRANIILEPEADLQKLEGIIKNYMVSVGDSKPDDWIGKNASLNTPELKAIRHKHFHFSASKLGAGYKPRLKNNRRVRYIYDA